MSGGSCREERWGSPLDCNVETPSGEGVFIIGVSRGVEELASTVAVVGEHLAELLVFFVLGAASAVVATDVVHLAFEVTQHLRITHTNESLLLKHTNLNILTTRLTFLNILFCMRFLFQKREYASPFSQHKKFSVL